MTSNYNKWEQSPGIRSWCLGKHESLSSERYPRDMLIIDCSQHSAMIQGQRLSAFPSIARMRIGLCCCC